MREIRNPVLVAIVVVSLAIGLSSLTRGHFWWDDFASYIMQAKSILDGNLQEFIERNTFTIFQSSFQIGPIAYPWGFPLILAPVYAVTGLNPLALKLPGVFFFAGFLICLFLVTNKRLTRTESLLLVSLFAFNPMLLSSLDLILSDIPFLFFSTLTLLLMIDRKGQSSLLQNVMLGTVTFLAFFIRTTGIILLASLLTNQAIRIYQHRRERNEIKTNLRESLQVLLVFGLLWLITSLVFPDGHASYLEQLKGLTLLTFTGNVSAYFFLFGQFFGEAPAWVYVYLVLFIPFVTGIWARRKDDPPLIIFFILYLLPLLIWPEWQGIRFIFPLLPLFIYFTFQGISDLIRRLAENKHEIGRIFNYGFWIIILVIFLFDSAGKAYGNLKNNREINGPFDSYSMETYDFIKDKTAKDSIIVFFKPRAMRLMTDRDSIMSIECDRMLLGDYIVLSRKVGENSQIPPERIDECNLPLDRVFQNRRFIIYKIWK